MAIAWTIEGEAGKALDETSRACAIVGEDFQLHLEGVGIDTLSWSKVLTTPDGSGDLLPEEGQEIALYRDGVCVFHGTVDAVRPDFQEDSWRATVSCVGAGWWLEREELNSLIPDDTEEDVERPQIEFTAGSLKGHIEALLARAASIGLPVAAGTIDALYDVPQATLANMTFLAALAERLSQCPDAIAWWDYTAKPAELNIARRGSAGVLSLDFSNGEDANGVRVTSVQLRPRPDLEAASATVHYAERLANGGIALNEDSTEKTRATLTTAMTGANNDITLTARRSGAGGNSITFAISGTTRDDLEVERSGTAITVYRKTGGNTAAEVVDAINTAPPMTAFQRKTNTVLGNARDVTVRAVDPGTAGNGVTLQFDEDGGALRVKSVVGKVVTIGWNDGVFTNDVIPIALVMEVVLADPAASLVLEIESALFDMAGDPAGLFSTNETFVCAGGNPGASTLVYAELAAGNDGTGTVTTLSATNLSGGSDGTAPDPGRRVRTTVSGPELADSLPLDEAEFVKVRTASLTSFQLFKDFDPRIREIIEAEGDFTLTAWVGPDANYRGTEPTTTTATPGGYVAVTEYLRTTEVREWMYRLGSPRFQPVVRAGTYVYVVNPYTNYASLTDLEKAIRDKSDWWVVIPGSPSELRCYYELSCEVIGTDLVQTSTRPLYRPGTYEFQRPPADYAANLLAAQAWVPYEGTVTLEAAECDPAAVLGKVVNIVGGWPAWETMKATVAAIDFTLETGRTSLRLGAPARINSRTLTRRVQGTRKDNLVIA